MMVTGQASRRNNNRRKHLELIEKGICTNCRKNKAREGMKTCGICYKSKIRWR